MTGPVTRTTPVKPGRVAKGPAVVEARTIPAMPAVALGRGQTGGQLQGDHAAHGVAHDHGVLDAEGLEDGTARRRPAVPIPEPLDPARDWPWPRRSMAMTR